MLHWLLHWLLIAVGTAAYGAVGRMIGGHVKHSLAHSRGRPGAPLKTDRDDGTIAGLFWPLYLAVVLTLVLLRTADRQIPRVGAERAYVREQHRKRLLTQVEAYERGVDRQLANPEVAHGYAGEPDEEF